MSQSIIGYTSSAQSIRLQLTIVKMVRGQNTFNNYNILLLHLSLSFLCFFLRPTNLKECLKGDKKSSSNTMIRDFLLEALK